MYGMQKVIVHLGSTHGCIEADTLLLDIATRNVSCLAPAASIGDAAFIMAEKRISSVVVTDGDGRPLSIVTERDILLAMQANCAPDTALRRIMPSRAFTVPETISCLDAYQVCIQEGIRHLLIVTAENRLAGVVSETDFRLNINLSILTGRNLVTTAMRRAVFRISPETHLYEALNLLHANRDTCVVVVDAERPIGIITERDIVRLYSRPQQRSDIPVREIMSSPVACIAVTDTLIAAAERMLLTKLRHLAVIDGTGLLAGLLSEHDITHNMALGLMHDKQAAERQRVEVELAKYRADLEARENAFRTLVENTPNTIARYDRNCRRIYANPALLQSIAKPETEVVGKTPLESSAPSTFTSMALYQETLEQVLASGLAAEFLLEWCNAKGETVFSDIRLVPERDPAGQVVSVLAIGQDITEHERAKQALKSECEKNLALLHNASDGIHVLDMFGNILEVSDTFCTMLGYSREELIGMNVAKWDVNFNSAERKRMLSKQSLLKVRSQFETRHRRKDGGIFPVEVSGFSVELTDKPVLFYSSRDITQRKLAEEQLHLAASVFTHSREAIMITKPDGRIVDVNGAFTRITGFSRDEVLGRKPSLLSSGRHDADFYAAFWRSLLGKGHWYGEIWNRRKNGEVYAEMLTISTVGDAQGAIGHYVALFSDITSHKEHERQLEHIAHFDALTNLPNRVLLADRLQQGMAHAQRQLKPLAVVYLDLDGFKNINDTYGHEVGDQVLINVALRMRQSLREGDTLSRLGGDEFVAVLLGQDSLETSAPLLARILAAAAKPIKIDQLELQVSASLGVTFYPQDMEVDADQLLRQADQAMYQAKLAGKNRFHIFDTAQDSHIRGRHEGLERIRNALRANEFVVYYQPKVHMRTGKLIGAEALLRWRHPTKGLLPPAVFLPVIEEHELSIQVGEWVIGTVLSQLEAWQALGLDIAVSVNLSARQLQQLDFVARLQHILAAHPLVAPSRLQLELLETSALEDVEQVSQIIAACRAIGVCFALDDFGTGYSSLTYLKRLPVTQLKIDQSFVRGMLDDPDDLAILEGILSLASAFRCQVIAEGVETIEHGELLLQLGCEFAQGYGIARPMPAHELAQWAARWRTYPAWANLPTMSREDIPLLFVGVEHRAWLAGIEKHFNNLREISFPQEHNECRFELWLNTQGLSRYAERPGFAVIKPLHRQIHALTAELFKLQGRDNAALAKISELYRLRDEFNAQLQELVQGNR
jgi:diguanylate cyclase (GGDEF)-like protein/PAS domain S-box-containing protein